MAYQFKLQVPISKELNEQLKLKAKEVGFNSVNDIARLLLTNFAKGNLGISFIEKPLAKKKRKSSIEDFSLNEEELEEIIAQGIAEYEANKTKEVDFSKSVHEQLIQE